VPVVRALVRPLNLFGLSWTLRCVSSAADFDAFVRGRQVGLARLAFSLTGDEQAALDLVQRALVQTWARWGRVQEPYAYARRILVNDVARQRQRSRALVVPVPELPDAAVPGEVERSENASILLEALLQLPPRTRAVVVLRFREDLSEKQTSELLGMSVGSVKSHGSRGLAALRKHMDPTLSTSERGPR